MSGSRLEIERTEVTQASCKDCGWTSMFYASDDRDKKVDEWVEHHSDPKHVKRDKRKEEAERQKTLRRWQKDEWRALCGKCFEPLELSSTVVQIQPDGMNGYLFKPCECASKEGE